MPNADVKESETMKKKFKGTERKSVNICSGLGIAYLCTSFRSQIGRALDFHGNITPEDQPHMAA